jgi:hypothetical protein
MSTLFGFGDSFTGGHFLDKDFKPYQQWKEYRGGNLPPIWIELLGEKLNMEVLNYGHGGNSNQETFETICNNCYQFKKDDIVIINWTEVHRFRWVAYGNHRAPEGIFNVDYWRRISAASDDSQEINNTTKMEIIDNRSSYLYVEEIYSYENIIDTLSKSIGFTVFYWSGDSSIIYKLPPEKLKQKKYIISDLILNSTEQLMDKHRIGGIFFDTIKHYGGLTVREETNGNCTDTHLGESGHRVQYELFYDYIIKNI